MKRIAPLVFLLFPIGLYAQETSTESSSSAPATEAATQNTQSATPAEQAPQTVQQVEYQEPQKQQKKQKSTAKHEDQKKSAMPFIKKLYFGGTFGATFGNYTTITVAPTIGYRLRPSLYTGLKVYYTYSKQKYGGDSHEYHNYGVGTFLRYYTFKDLYLHVAPEYISYEYTTVDGSDREWVPYLWAGAGIRKKTSRRSWVSVHVLFDLLQNSNSPFDEWEPNVVIGAGTSF